MKTEKKLVSLSVVMTVLFAGQTQAGVTQDSFAKMKTLLGHDPAIMSVLEAQKQNLDSAKSKFQPWSGSYWPDIIGGIANHYRQQGAFGSKIKLALRYDSARGRFHRKHAESCEMYPSLDLDALSNKLSPSEKYDLLIGNTEFNFTRAILDELDFRDDYRITTKNADGSDSDSDSDEGVDNNFFYEDDADNRAYAKVDNKFRYRYWRKKGGSLAYWSGICDGWSPAALYLPRPEKPVTLRATNGQFVTFYPDDIKALGSYLFARTNTPYYSTMNYQFAGRKCSEKGTAKIDNAGYIKDIQCNDMDAGIWHLSLINRIGKDKMGFVMDVDNNLKINNHPVGEYSLSYFNPATGQSGSLQDSVISRHAVRDRYQKRRHPKAKYLLGVKSQIQMVYYYWPEKNKEDDYDDASKDKLKKREYTYDLELDENYNVLGGEWGDRSKENRVVVYDDGTEERESDEAPEQPDFIWMAAKEALPHSEMSFYANPGVTQDLSNPRPFGNMQWNWDGKSALPEDWLASAKKDQTWSAPVAVEDRRDVDSTPAAHNSILKSAQPLSHIVYYLFDQSRSNREK
jgi:hypothetical protein